MPLLLKAVEPARGARWVSDAFRLYARRPLAFALMLIAFVAAALVISLLPGVLGLALQLALVPLLSLGFMVASQSALLGGPVRPLQFIEPLRGDAKRRNALLVLCLIYGLSATGIFYLCDAISGHGIVRLMVLAGQGSNAQQEVESLFNDPLVSEAAIVGLTLVMLLSVPFWHAPALVHWGAQGVAQALFSSTLALWRTKGAFLVYSLGWMAALAACCVIGFLLVVLPFTRNLAPLFLAAAMLVTQTVFYVSLLFSFNDSFGGTEASTPAV
jgi:hypothetical protein